MTRSFIIGILLAFGAYGLTEAWPLLTGPTLSITSPKDESTAPDGVVTVSGKAAHVALLTLDGAPLLHEEDGSFSSLLTFPRGGSILTFVATDRFGRHVTTTRTIFVP